MKRFELNGLKFTSREEAYRYMREVFEFPEYFGNNLDALWDELSFSKDMFIEIRNARAIAKQLGEYGLKILDIFGDLDEIEGIIVFIKW